MNEEKLFSVVLRTKNEIKNIKNFVESYKLQTYLHKELIVVDNYSTDGTREWLNSQGIPYHLKGDERVEQGNYGMLELSKGRWIGYFDADMYMSSNLISSLVNFFSSNSNLVAVRIREIILGKSLGSRVRRFERRFYENTCVDAARVFERNALFRVGGFDLDCFQANPSAEDWDLDRRIADLGKIGFLDNSFDENYSEETKNFARTRGVSVRDNYPCFFHNESEFSWKWYLNKKKYYSKSIGSYIKKWGENDRIVKLQLGLKYRFFQVFFEQKKYKLVLQKPHYMFILWMQLFAVGIIFTAISKSCDEKSDE